MWGNQKGIKYWRATLLHTCLWLSARHTEPHALHRVRSVSLRSCQCGCPCMVEEKAGKGGWKERTDEGRSNLSRTNINMFQHKREALEIKRRKQNYTNTYGADGTWPERTSSSNLLLPLPRNQHVLRIRIVIIWDCIYYYRRRSRARAGAVSAAASLTAAAGATWAAKSMQLKIWGAHLL
jgi:hypothetical protein